MADAPSVAGLMQATKSNTEATITNYNDIFDETDGEKIDERKAHYMQVVNQYYDLVTDFYEYGWGESFHFAPRYNGEAFLASVARYETYLAYRLNLQPGMTCLDLGCGVGGPLREIARFTRAKITGVNNNEYQIKRGQKKNAALGIDWCNYQKADFMNLPFEDNEMDAAYAIEATCHAPDKVACYSEIFRVLKPGAKFAMYEWVVTDKYDPNNREHVTIKKNIEYGDGLPDLDTPEVVHAALEEAGFEILEVEDRALTSEVPWYAPLDAKYTLTGFRYTKIGRSMTHYMVSALECCRIAPKGSTATSSMLQVAADALVAGGKTGIFTPMYFVVVQKPE